MRFTAEQMRVIDRRDGPLMVAAGAGTGKTSVLVERFVRAVIDDGVAVEAMLAITFTEKAAAELKRRVRERFAELDRRDLARAAETAWISTIHGFCARLLRAHALAAGIDPEYRVLDGVEAERIGMEAFESALDRFLRDGRDAERLTLVARYTPDRLADMVRTTHGHLRSRGQERPELRAATPPEPGGRHAELDTAARAALDEIERAGGVTAERVRDCLARLRELLAETPPGEPADPAAVEQLCPKPGTVRALAGPAMAAAVEAYEAYASLCVAQREHRDRTMIGELLRGFGEQYAERKRVRSGLDFDDLELRTMALLRDDPELLAPYGFEHAMVDEFQDTNPLQNRILEAIGVRRLFRVGDERQSIYRFRHADVGVFRSHFADAEAAGRAERIGINFRSRGEVLDAIDLAFTGIWGDGYDPLREREGARAGAPAVEPCVELMVVDRHPGRWAGHWPGDEPPFGPAMEALTYWRAAEARLLARRIDELTGPGGPFDPADVVVLVRATTNIGDYATALEERGVPTYVVGGRGYFSQQQVGDLSAWLAALANPLDDLALVTALACPIGGVSLDALVLIAAAARTPGWSPWRVIEALARDEPPPEPATELARADRDRATAFARRLAADRFAAPRMPLETLLDRAVTESGYDRHVLALAGGDRRMANIRKLMRFAREYEAREGRDLRGFIDALAERSRLAEREGDAPLEAEDVRAVRLMTIHRAKGLEFPVVCVADLGREGSADDSALRVSDDGNVGIRMSRLGGGTISSETLAKIAADQRLEDEAEEQRVLYVGATRAREHLILSGATDLDKRPEAKPLAEPMRWLWRELAPGLPQMGARAVATGAWEGREVRVQVTKLAPDTAGELLSDADREPVAADPEPAGLGALAAPALAAVPVPRALAVSRISYSGLQRYARCGYRFYLERALALPDHELLAFADPPPAAGERLAGRVRGSIVHELLERLDFGAPAAPSEAAVAQLIAAHGEPERPGDAADVAALVAGFAGSAMCERIAAASAVATELPFAFALTPPGGGGRSLLVNGIVDVRAEERDRVLVVDYKSDRLGGSDPAELTERSYATQRTVYALAALRAGAPRVEVAYVFLERPGEPVSAVFEAGDAGTLERRLAELAAGVVAGRFEPSDRPNRLLCGDCPGRSQLCSWGPARTLADPPEGEAPGHGPAGTRSGAGTA